MAICKQCAPIADSINHVADEYEKTWNTGQVSLPGLRQQMQDLWRFLDKCESTCPGPSTPPGMNQPIAPPEKR
jgi:hypothetical protein